MSAAEVALITMHVAGGGGSREPMKRTLTMVEFRESRPDVLLSKLQRQTSSSLHSKHLSGRTRSTFSSLNETRSNPGFLQDDPLRLVESSRIVSLQFLPASDKIEVMRSINPKKLETIMTSVKLNDEEKTQKHKNQTAQQWSQGLGLGPVDLKNGLSLAQVTQSKKLYGENKLPPGEKEWFVQILAWNLIQPSMLILWVLIALTIYSMGSSPVGDIQGADIFTLVALSVILFASSISTAVSEYNTGDALGKLMTMAQPSALVRRDGEEQTIKSSEVVVGDIVIFKMGDTAPADMVLAATMDVKMVESALTGEPQDCAKTLIVVNPDANFPSNRIYSSTACVSGRGEGLVTDVGLKTQVGIIAGQISISHEAMSPLQRTMAWLGGWIIVGVVVMVIVLGVVMGLTTASSSTSTRFGNQWIDAFYDALQLSIIVVPATLPLTVVLMMKEGVRTLASRNVIVRRMTCIETLGSATVICSDKTGTLTEGKMTATNLTSSDGQSYVFWPSRGVDPRGGVFLERDTKNPDIMSEVTGVLFGQNPTSSLPITNHGCPAEEEEKEGSEDDGLLGDAKSKTQTQGSSSSNSSMVRRAVGATFLNCDKSAKLVHNKEKDQFVAFGNMTEIALVVAAAKAGFTWEDFTPPAGFCNGADKYPHQMYPLVDELSVPFSSVRKMCATVHFVENGIFFGQNLPEGSHYVAILKGAPDNLSAFIGGENALEVIKQVNDAYASQALRVILTAMCSLTSAQVDDMRNMDDADTRLAFLTSNQVDQQRPPLSFVCCFGLKDPPREGVRKSIDICHGAFVRVIMITGDQLPTAKAISDNIGIHTTANDGTSLCKESRQLHQDPSDPTSDLISDHLLEFETKHVNTWARAQPMDKLAIVNSLRRQKNVVVMTGDGVNDAAALKEADIGVAMGIAGTDVAKEASDLILNDDNFCTIVEAAKVGRRLFGNLQKYVLYYLGTKAGELVLFSIAIFGNVFKPMGGLLGLLAALSLTFSTPITMLYQHEEEYQMVVPPRDAAAQVLSRLHWTLRVLPLVFIYQFSVLGPTMLMSMIYRKNVAMSIETKYFDELTLLEKSCLNAFYKSPMTGEWTVLQNPVICSCPQDYRLPTSRAARSLTANQAVITNMWWQVARVNVSGVSLVNPNGLVNQTVADEYGWDYWEWAWTGNSGSLYRLLPDLKQLEDFVAINSEASGLFVCNLDSPHSPRALCWGERETLLYGNASKPDIAFPHIASQYSCGKRGYNATNSVGWLAWMWTELFFLVSVRTENFVFCPSRRKGGACNSMMWGCFWLSWVFMFVLVYVPPIALMLSMVAIKVEWVFMTLTFALAGLMMNEGFKVLYNRSLAKHNEFLIKQYKQD